MNNFDFQRSANDHYIDFQGMGGLMLETLYQSSLSFMTMKVSGFRANFILHVRKELNQRSFDVDFDVSFLFICVCLKYRRTCIFHTIVSFTYFICPFYMWPKKKHLVFLIFLTINFWSVTFHLY